MKGMRGKEERRGGGRKEWEEGKVGEEMEGERMKEVGKEEEGKTRAQARK